MDSVREAFTKIFRVTVSDSYFAIHHIKYPVKLYSRKTGKFLCNIGRKGNGPGEYFQIWNTVIEEDYNRFYLVNQFKNYIYSYDLNGNFHEMRIYTSLTIRCLNDLTSLSIRVKTRLSFSRHLMKHIKISTRTLKQLTVFVSYRIYQVNQYKQSLLIHIL